MTARDDYPWLLPIDGLPQSIGCIKDAQRALDEIDRLREQVANLRGWQWQQIEDAP